MVAAVVAAFLYLRIMVNMWLAEPEGGDEAEAVIMPFSAGVAIFGAAAFTLFAGVFPGWLIDAAETVSVIAR
jgi:NADH-quinone oxidoreductase subunit N